MQFSAARLARASFVFAFAIASIGVASKAQQSEVPPPPDPGVSGSDTYVATWEDIQEERSKAFATLGIAPQQQALRAQVRNSARKLVQNNLTATRSAEIPDLFIDEIAQLLLSIGYGPGDLPKSQGDATSTILSAQNVVSGNPTFDDYLALSKDVVVATVKSISAAQDADDGMNLTVTFTVDKVAKGNLQPGQTVTIRQYSNSPPGASPANPEGQYLLFLSQARYDYVSARRAGRRPQRSGQVFGEVFQPYRVEGDRLLSVGEGQPVPTKAVSAI
jgi:hypothetical protein